MKLPFGFGDVDWSDWVRGLFAAFISGGASAVVSGIAVSTSDPDHFAFGTTKFYELVFSVFMASGLLNMFSFLRTKPIPDLKTVTTTVTTTGKATDPNPLVKTTVRETQVVAASTPTPAPVTIEPKQ